MTHEYDTLLDEGYILDAASGAAPAAVRVLAACQCELNEFAARRMGSAETAFGALLECGPTAPVSADLFDRTAALLGEDTDAPAASDTAAPSDATLPRALTKHLPDTADLDWRPRFGGLSEVVIDDLCEPGVHARLLKLPSGGSAPEHAHGGDEITLVLAGAFRDEVSRYAAGEICHAASGHRHRPVVEGDQDCICFVVEFGPLRPTNPILSFAGSVLGRIF